MVSIVLILSLAALVITEAMDFFTTVRHVGPAAEQNPVAIVLFARWGFGGGLFFVGLIWTAIVVATYVVVFLSESDLVKLATAAVGFFVASAQWSAARFNSTGHRSWLNNGSLEWSELLAEEQRLAKEQKNVADAIATYGLDAILLPKISELKAAQEVVKSQRRRLDALRSRPLELPSSSWDLREMIEANLGKLAIESPACGDFLRQLVPSIHVYLVRACDGGHPLPRAKVQLALDGVIPDAKHAPEFATMLRRTVTIDFFEPAQRVRILADVERLSVANLNYAQIAERIAEKPSDTAVGHSLKLIRMMKELGLTSPYVLMHKPPEDYPKHRKHLNSKYSFTPVPGYVPPPI